MREMGNGSRYKAQKKNLKQHQKAGAVLIWG